MQPIAVPLLAGLVLALAPVALDATEPSVPALTKLERRLLANQDRDWPASDRDAVDHVLRDGPYLLLHHRIYGDGSAHGTARVEIWKLGEHGVESHMAISQPIPDHALNDATMACGPAVTERDVPPAECLVGNDAGTSATVAAVKAYLADGGGPDGHAGAVNRHVSEDFVQHSPHIPQGKAALAAYFSARDPERKAAGWTSRDLLFLAQGNLAVLVHDVIPGDPAQRRIYADFFKVCGKLVCEHWDVIETTKAP